MAAEVLAGKAVLYGIQNDGTAISMTGYATFILDALVFKHMFDIRDVKDERGFDTSAVATNEHGEITIDFTPAGATRAAAEAIVALPAPLSSFTLSHVKLQTGVFSGTSVKMFDGAYQYRGGASINLSSSDIVKVSGITLRKYADSTQNTSLVTTVTG